MYHLSIYFRESLKNAFANDIYSFGHNQNVCKSVAGALCIGHMEDQGVSGFLICP